nr:tRNA-splicing endonuclease subunit Sen2 isoform X1 [Zonotrichia albicollis]
MAEAVFHPPKRKRRVFESYKAAFPVDVGGKDFRLCQAEIINNNVIVRNPEDIEQLYNKGYFGKGILSRSRPVFSISDPQLEAKWRGVNTNMPIITAQKYQRRVQWARSVLQEQGLDSCSISRILESYTQPLGLPYCTGDGDGQAGHSCTTGSTGNAELGRKCGREGTQSPESHSQHSQEGGDPGRASRAQEHPREMAEGSCHRDPAEGKQSPEQRAWQGMDSRECAPEYVLVQEEEEGSSCPEDDSTHAQENLVKKEVLVCRKNPFRIFEYLQLSLEEAFFLVYALGCLSIYYGEEPLSIVKLWEVFSEVKPDFKTTYMAYHYFRGKGWVPKVGLKYGTDLCECLPKNGVISWPPLLQARQNCRGSSVRSCSTAWSSLCCLHWQRAFGLAVKLGCGWKGTSHIQEVKGHLGRPGLLHEVHNSYRIALKFPSQLPLSSPKDISCSVNITGLSPDPNPH